MVRSAGLRLVAAAGSHTACRRSQLARRPGWPVEAQWRIVGWRCRVYISCRTSTDFRFQTLTFYHSTSCLLGLCGGFWLGVSGVHLLQDEHRIQNFRHGHSISPLRAFLGSCGGFWLGVSGVHLLQDEHRIQNFRHGHSISPIRAFLGADVADSWLKVWGCTCLA